MKFSREDEGQEYRLRRRPLQPDRIRLKEIRVVADDEAAIIGAVNELRRAYTYVFTTGGIGPTHDDITADSISRALGV